MDPLVEFVRWASWGHHWFDLLLAFAFLYLFAAVDQLEERAARKAKFVSGLALFLILAKWLTDSPPR